jgi:phage protein D
LSVVNSYTELFGPRFFLEADGALARDIIPYITRFEYDEEENKISTMRIVVANPYFRFKDDPRFKEGARFRVRFGYPGDFSDVKNAVISRALSHYPSGGVPTIDMVAFNLEKDLNKTANPYNYGPVSSSSIATIVAKRYSFATDIEESNDGRRQHRVQPAGVSDIQYLFSLANKLNWDCYIQGATLHFHKKRYDSASALEFIYYTDRKGTLLSFNPEVNMNKPPATKVAGADSRGGKAADAGRPPAPKPNVLLDTENGTVGPLIWGTTNQNQTPVAQPGETGIVSSSAESDKRVIAIHGNAKASKIDMSAIKASAEVIGTPRITSRTMIRISGVDQQYSGNWRVSKCTHVIEPKGVYKTNLSLKRDAGDGKGKGQNKNNAGAKKDAKAPQAQVLISIDDKGARVAGALTGPLSP